MSFLLEEEKACPACKYPNKVDVWSIVNVKEDPELKDLLLGGELNMTECASCKHIFYAEHFIIYHESDRELMAFVYPLAASAEAPKWKEKTAADFAAYQANAEPGSELTYQPVTLFGLDDLVQLVQKEEEMNVQSDIVKTLADQGNFSTKTLRAGKARELGLPIVLPLSGEGEPRERVKRGVEELLTINDRLFVYRDLLAQLENGQHERIDL